ncbi:MAG: hypothetical protein ACI88H_003577 [Cocleimonas sp.]|jgi:hypothetical protein
MNNLGEPLEFFEDTAGPGLLSGKDGSFSLFTKGAKKSNKETIQPKSVDKMTLEETSQVLNEKIERLERDKIELELLKKRIDNKLSE